MAILQFGNTAADMRLADDFYGIAALRDASLFLLTFVEQREEILEQTPTRLVFREWNADGHSITFSANGNTVSSDLFVANEFSAEAHGVLETWRGTVNVKLPSPEEDLTQGNVNDVLITNGGDSSLIASIAGVSLSPMEVIFLPEEKVLAGDDAIGAGNGNDHLIGYSGNDRLSGGFGDDTLNGDDGIDTASYSGALRQYTVASDRTQISGPEGTDTLVSIEKLAFVDGLVSFDGSDHLAQAYRLYFATLDREADALGLSYQAARLDAGTSLTEVAAGFVNSPEFRATYGSLGNEAFVGLLYQNVLDRSATPSEIAFHTGRMQSGASRPEIVVGFSESPEHIQKHAAEVNAGLWDVDDGMASIARLYFGMLERAPESAGLGFYKQQLAQGLTVQQVANGFAASPEFQTKYATPNDPLFVTQLYKNILERDPSPAELAFHTNRLHEGASRGDVAAGFTEAPEYQVKTMSLVDHGIAVADTGFVLP